MSMKIKDKLIINVGTLYRDHNPSVSIVDFENKKVFFYDIIDNIIKDDPEVISFE